MFLLLMLCSMRVQSDGHRCEAVDEVRESPFRLTRYFDLFKAFDDFFPDDLQLQLGQPVADAAMNAEAEGQMLARILAVDQELNMTS